MHPEVSPATTVRTGQAVLCAQLPLRAMNDEIRAAGGAAAQGVAQFARLPPELLGKILCQDALEVTDVLTFGATSKDLHAFIDGSAELWRTLYVRDFKKPPEEKYTDIAGLIKKRYRQK